MKILIIGTKGFIGSHLFQGLVNKYEVWGCDIFTDYTEKNFFLIDVANIDFKEIFRKNKFDICINCSGAASVPESFTNPSRDFELNVHAVFKILESIKLYTPECKFINLSSAAVYGDPQSFPICENHTINPLSPYGFHKLQAEQICNEFYRFHFLKTCSIRIFSAYGPGLRKQILWDLFKKSKNSGRVELFGNGDETRDYIFVEDIVDAIDAIILYGEFQSEIYNVANGKATSIREISDVFFQCLNWEGDVIFTGKKRTGDPDNWQADISKIRNLGFIPKVTIEEGIKRYVAWLRQLD